LSSYETIVRKCGEVAWGDADWPSLIAEVCRFVEGEKALLLVSDRFGVYHHSLSHRHKSEATERYNSGYNIADPRLPFSMTTAPGDARTGQQYLRNETFSDTEYFNEITVRADVMDSVHGVICDGEITGRIALSVQRGFGSDFFDTTSVKRMRAALPLLEQAVMLSAKLNLRSGMDDGMEASCMIDGESNVRFSRSADAQALEATGIGAVSNGRLLIRQSAIADLFARAFARPRLDSPVRFRIASEPPLYCNFRLSEVPEPMRWMMAGGRCLLLTFVTTPDVPDELTEQFAAAYGLTARERHIVQEVASSGNLRASAEALEISYETLRSHMKNVYEKTNFRTLSDVIQAVRTGDLSNLL
tara:strand:+ start:918 stop:1994 length:1077 start_codon:yes stop_codon:yes gene_type:complete